MRCFVAALTLTAAWMAAPPFSRAEEITFNKHIAPLVWKNCSGCHRPGEVGPFSLLTYRDVARKADFLVEVTKAKQMPPWKAEPGFGSFHDARVLTEAQLDQLARWARAGAPEGDPKDLPPAPKFIEGWQLGRPDLVLKMPKAFTVSAGGRDVYRCFVIPTNLTEDKTVAAVEFRAGNRKVVHHALMFLDANGSARKKDGIDGQPGYPSFGGPGILPTGALGAWAPGADSRPLPDGVGRLLRKGSDLVLQVHYHPSGKEETDQSSVGVYYTRKPADKLIGGVVIRGGMLLIPAGARDHRVTGQSQPLPVDVDALSIFPHMHLIGREMKVYAALPDGKTIPLIWIKDWDFNWQGSYTYSKPVRIPKGSVLKLEALYDNSTDNPRNPNNPPKVVRRGEGTTDEMSLCGLVVVTDTPAELRQITLMRGNVLASMLVGGVTTADLLSRGVGKPK